MAKTSFVDIEGCKQTPPKLSDEELPGCMLKRDLKNAVNSENASSKSERYGSIMRPTAGKDHNNQTLIYQRWRNSRSWKYREITCMAPSKNDTMGFDDETRKKKLKKRPMMATTTKNQDPALHFEFSTQFVVNRAAEYLQCDERGCMLHDYQMRQQLTHCCTVHKKHL